MRPSRRATIDPLHRPRLSGAALVVANALPLLGVLFLDWDLGRLLALYWVESAVIGVLNVVKMLMISPVRGLFSSVFFTVHFGLFMFVHAMFLSMFLRHDGGAGPAGGIAAEPEALARSVPWEFLALVGSHGFSFLLYWVIGDEAKRRSVGFQMFEPYRRIFVMHLAILTGGFAFVLLQSSALVLAPFVLLKTGFDLRAHLREHGALRRWPAVGPRRTSAP